MCSLRHAPSAAANGLLWGADTESHMQVENDLKKLHGELPLEEQLSALLRISLSLPGNVHALNILRQQNGEDQTVPLPATASVGMSFQLCG